MSALDALRSSVSGLNAQSKKLSGISNNIANSSTVGYKRVATQFESLVLEGSGSGASAMAGTTSHNRVEISKAGQVQSTGNATDIAVNGDGFLVVNEQSGSTGKYLATRAGSFRADQFGNLVNTAGYYLQGVPLDAAGKPLNGLGGNNIDSLTTVNVNSVTVASAPSTTISFWANLPASDTKFYTTAPTPKVSSVDYYDALGGAQTLTYKFTPTMAASAAAPATNIWTMEVFDTATGTGAVDAAARRVGQATLTFNASGPNAGTIDTVTATTPAAAYNPVDGSFTVPTGNSTGPTLKLMIGILDSASGMSQLEGAYTETKIEKDGSAFGLLQNIGVEKDGRVMATFSNGKSRPIYQLKLATFANADGMNPVRGDAYEMSIAAGAPRLLDPGTGAAGSVAGNALESSNVDMGTELTNLIETQRAYSSNATVIRTADQMLQEANELKR
ncbi:flagellar hook protein FlgE [Belnapia moabensis]|uniref:flagellar hook protein FlgE n=1 Tax=Belnapia moabensis TaxID=365533 RepID=UPI0005B8DCC6|nr:flagellar hook protein FlgE [Belnapia moabensis]